MGNFFISEMVGGVRWLRVSNFLTPPTVTSQTKGLEFLVYSSGISMPYSLDTNSKE
jgi:hypothetical protein